MGDITDVLLLIISNLNRAVSDGLYILKHACGTRLLAYIECMFFPCVLFLNFKQTDM